MSPLASARFLHSGKRLARAEHESRKSGRAAPSAPLADFKGGVQLCERPPSDFSRRLEFEYKTNYQPLTTSRFHQGARRESPSRTGVIDSTGRLRAPSSRSSRAESLISCEPASLHNTQRCPGGWTAAETCRRRMQNFFNFLPARAAEYRPPPPIKSPHSVSRAVL